MEVEKLDLNETHCFSDFFLDYVNQKPKLKEFSGRPPQIDQFEEQLKNRKFPEENRKVLVEALTKQYSGFEISDLTSANIESLKQENTFTITTGHQLNIFTGPLYFLYKIATVVNACKELRLRHPEFSFVPVYWMASEDHDFDEISYAKIAGKKYVWETDQHGAVGRFDPKGLLELLKEIPGKHSIFEKAYGEHRTLAQASRYYVNELFKEDGLVVIDGDGKELKKQFSDVIEADMFENIPNQLVQVTSSKLEDLGYKPQVFSRPINFFFLKDNLRDRLEKNEDGTFVGVDSGIRFTEQEMRELVSSSPESFSPNVILRGLYQETILPNLAYVGGPAEMVYWLQLKEMFHHFSVPFPILLPRNFALLVPKHVERKRIRTAVPMANYFLGIDDLKKKIALERTEHDLEFGGNQKAIQNQFVTISNLMGQIDVTLQPLVEAEMTRASKSIEKIRSKGLRAIKRSQSDLMTQLEDVKEQLFPNGGQQERTENFLGFIYDNPDLVDLVKKNLAPFDLRYHLIVLS